MEEGFVKKYWERRYKNGGNSGLGSYDIDAINFKANYVNDIIKKNNIKSMVELGCGDGNQLKLFNGYKKYIGNDISITAVNSCKEIYKDDPTKEFEYDINKIMSVNYDMSLSLDVIYHLVEDSVFYRYIDDLFSMSDIICLYTTNTDKLKGSTHIKHRDVEMYVNENYDSYELIDKTSYHNYNVMFLLYKKK
jgi:SAM-dependent methyltransferase